MFCPPLGALGMGNNLGKLADELSLSMRWRVGSLTATDDLSCSDVLVGGNCAEQKIVFHFHEKNQKKNLCFFNFSCMTAV